MDEIRIASIGDSELGTPKRNASAPREGGPSGMEKAHSQLPSRASIVSGSPAGLLRRDAAAEPERPHQRLSQGARCTEGSLAPELGYLDLTGSGNETSAHLLETRRTTLTKWAAVKGAEGLEAYRTEKNEASRRIGDPSRAPEAGPPRSPRADHGSRDYPGTAGFRAISSTIAGGLCPRGRVRPVRTNPRPT